MRHKVSIIKLVNTQMIIRFQLTTFTHSSSNLCVTRFNYTGHAPQRVCDTLCILKHFEVGVADTDSLSTTASSTPTIRVYKACKQIASLFFGTIEILFGNMLVAYQIVFDKSLTEFVSLIDGLSLSDINIVTVFVFVISYFY